MRNYTIFSSSFMRFVEAQQIEKHTPSNLILTYGIENDYFNRNIFSGLLKAHLFEVSDDIKRLLVLTKTPKINEMLKIPFSVIFIDVEFKRKEMLQLAGVDIGFDIICGIIVQNGVVVQAPNEEVVGTDLRISICAFDNYTDKRGNTDKAVIFETYSEEINWDSKKIDKDKVKYRHDKDLNLKTRRFIHAYVLNFLNFINNPEVQYVTVEADTKRNEKRVRECKVPIPSRSIIKLSGTLKHYIEDIKRNPMWHYNYRFWVRGHFRTLHDKKYGENVGKRTWVFPYVKGKGILIEKKYILK